MSRRRSTARILVLLVAALAFGLASCTFPSSDSSSDSKTTALPTGVSAPDGVKDPAVEPALKTFYGQTVDWADCSDGFQCAKVKVPVSWDKPAGDTIQIAAVRRPAEGTKLGSLLINPGGPGVSGVSYARVAEQAFGAAILRNYDIVGFDPRGIGESDPVECLPDSQLDAYVAADTTPDDQSELDAAVADVKRFAAACRLNSGALLDDVDTLSTVKDLDVLRAVLGDEVLSFQGLPTGRTSGPGTPRPSRGGSDEWCWTVRSIRRSPPSSTWPVRPRGSPGRCGPTWRTASRDRTVRCGARCRTG